MSGYATGWVGNFGPRPDDIDSAGKPYGARARGLRFVLIAVADAANKEGQHAHPGIGNVAEFALYSVGQARRLLTELVNEGWLEVMEHGQGRHATVYDLRTDWTNPHLSNRAPCALYERPKPRTADEETARDEEQTAREDPANRASGCAPNGTTVLPTVELSTRVDDPFDAFWSVYPRGHDKESARRAFAKALRKATAEEITAGAIRYRDDPNRSPQFTKMAATWLNAGAWDNPPLPARRNGSGPAPAPIMTDRDAPGGQVFL